MKMVFALKTNKFMLSLTINNLLHFFNKEKNLSGSFLIHLTACLNKEVHKFHLGPMPYTSGQFHQLVYAKLLRPQIPKAQKAA